MPYQTIWAGGSVVPSGGDRIVSVEGTWTVPYARTKRGALDGISYISSSWIGIDDLTIAHDILQAGIDVVVATDGSLAVRPWRQWVPDHTEYLPEDELSLRINHKLSICIAVETSQSARIVFKNVTLGIEREYPVSPTPTNNQQCSGVCAEWIVEAIVDPHVAEEPPPQNPVLFTNCRATTRSGQILKPDSPASSVKNIIDESGHAISDTTIVNDTIRVEISTVSV